MYFFVQTWGNFDSYAKLTWAFNPTEKVMLLEALMSDSFDTRGIRTLDFSRKTTNAVLSGLHYK